MPNVEKAVVAAVAADDSEARSPPTDRDVAVAIVGEERFASDPAVSARARRKIDFLLIPTMTVGCMWSFSCS